MKIIRNNINVLFYTLLFILVSSSLSATNLQIDNVNYNSVTRQVSFDISWQNSWRLGSNLEDQHDAVWIFVKYQTCDARFEEYQHVRLSTLMNDHTIGSSLLANPIDDNQDNTGIMLRRATTGSGDISPTHIVLQTNNIPLVDINDIRVHGIEMTFIQEDPFLVGDGLRNRWILREGGDNGNAEADPFLIDSEDAILVGDQAGRLWCTPNTPSLQIFPVEQGFLDTETEIPATFPKGFESFYAMKMEITQQQYADFLNTISFEDFTNFYPGAAPPIPGTMLEIYSGFPVEHHNVYSLTGDWPTVDAIRPHQAQVWISWNHIRAFLSWAALRPLTDLEYEKICRGTDTPTPFQAAWGDFTNTIPGQRLNTGTSQETVTNAGQHGVTSAIFDGDPSKVIYTMRVGYQGVNGTTRTSLSAGFYGNLNMSGNVFESYVSLRDASMAYEGTWGKGSTNIPVDWEGIEATVRGGGWGLVLDWEINISSRSFVNVPDDRTYNNSGGRGGR